MYVSGRTRSAFTLIELHNLNKLILPSDGQPITFNFN
jgi:hypothetical protein